MSTQDAVGLQDQAATLVVAQRLTVNARRHGDLPGT
jgi:hypothetical protein